MLRQVLQIVVIVVLVQQLVSYLHLLVYSTSRPPRDTTPHTMSPFRAVFVTVPSTTVAKTLATGIVERKLAACVNIIPQITSVYEWEGIINEDTEILLMIKTQAHLFDELSTYVKANHPYDVPEVIGLPIEQGSSDYLDWIKKVTKPQH